MMRQINERGVEGAMVAGSKEEREGTSLVQDLCHNGRIFYQELKPYNLNEKSKNTWGGGAQQVLDQSFPPATIR